MDGMEIETVEVGVESNGRATLTVPDSAAMPATPAPTAELSFKPGNLMADLELLRQEMGTAETVTAPPQAVQVPTKTEPVTKEPEQSATTPATPIPDKFKNPDGTVNQEKIEKSTLNAEEAYAKFAEIEKKMRQAQNAVATLKQAPVAPAPAVPQVPITQNLTPLELTMAQDLINESAALGIQLDQRLAIAQARVMAKGLEAKNAYQMDVTTQIRERLEDQDRRMELEVIAKHDQWVLSPEGIETLSRIRQERPHVNASDRPWRTAYREHLADQAMKQTTQGQVLNPTPTGQTAKAPPTPVGPAPRVVVKPSEPVLQTKEQVDAHLATLDEKGLKAFFASRNLRY